MEARNKYVWHEGSDDLEPGSQQNGMGLSAPAERVTSLRRRAVTTRRRTSEPARGAHQSRPVDTIVGPARPAPAPAGETSAHPASAVDHGVAVPPGLADRLREQQVELQARLTRLAGEAQEWEEDTRPRYSNHPADEAGALLDRAGRDAVARVLLADMAQVDIALDRLAAGSYGLCDDCHQPIPPKRLQARPTATLCVTCQSRREARAARGIH